MEGYVDFQVHSMEYKRMEGLKYVSSAEWPLISNKIGWSRSVHDSEEESSASDASLSFQH